MEREEQVKGLQLFLSKRRTVSTKESVKPPHQWIIGGKQRTTPRKGKDEFTTTKHQHYDALSTVRSKDLRAEDASRQSSEEWLVNHGLVALGLTTRDLIALGRLPLDNEGKSLSARVHTGDEQGVQLDLKKNLPSTLEYDLETVTEFECGLHAAIVDYTMRVKWLMQNTRRVFGLIKGEHVGLLIDASNANLGYGRDRLYRQHLIQLIDEQLSASHIQTLFVTSYGTETKSLWPVPMTTNSRVIDEVKTYVREEMQPSGSSNLLDGIKHLMRHGRRVLDCLVIVCGSCPDQAGPHIISYTEQVLAGYDTPRLHLVDYDSRNPGVSQFLAGLASVRPTNSFHCFATSNDGPIYTSDDIARLVKEISDAQDLLRLVQQLRLETENAKLLSDEAMREALELARSSARSPIHHLPQPPELHILHGPLNLPELEASENAGTTEKKFQSGSPKPIPSTSRDWLDRQGLKARNLGLFQVLSPNAYSQVTGYVPSIKRSVTAQIHEQCMVQMRWPDGTIKNVHVDHAQLFEYQKQLTALVGLLEKRVHWLTRDSRGYFGSVVEPHVVILVDLSQHNAVYLVHIQYCLRHVLEQQISQRSTFNVIALGSVVRAFRPRRVPVTVANLQAAWDWFRQLQCAGTRNVLAGLRFALENEATRELDESPQGIYIFASGIPDQEGHAITSYLEGKSCTAPNLHVHVALYNVDDYDIVTGRVLPCRYANISKTEDTLRSIANCTGGRFHWFRENGIIESDDIRVLLDEIDMAVEFSQQCRLLVDSVQTKPNDRENGKESGDSPPIMINRLISTEDKQNPTKSIAPRLNALANARQSMVQHRLAQLLNPVPPKALAWARGVSAISSAPKPMQAVNQTARPRSTPDQARRCNEPGQVERRAVDKRPFSFHGHATIPKEEEQLTSRDWLRKYSIRSLGLTLAQLVSGAACRHEMSYVNPIGSHVEARYCAGLFPIVNVAGTLRHLQYTSGELEVFKNEVCKVLKRYLMRLNWHLCGSRRYFGVITENCVVILIDISGSMKPHLDEVKHQLKCLIWEQLFKKNIVFNLIAFNSELTEWQSTGPTVPDESACHDAVAWLDQLEAFGGTATGEAVCRALHHLNLVNPQTGVCSGARRPPWMCDNNASGGSGSNPTRTITRAIYLFTDGKPDSSCTSVLQLVRDSWNSNVQHVQPTTNNTGVKKDKTAPEVVSPIKRRPKKTVNVCEGPLIHAISFTEDQTAITFLRKLAHMTGGRFHRVLNDAACTTLKRNIQALQPVGPSYTSQPELVLPREPHGELGNLGSDDLDALIKEINGARQTIEKIEYFQHVYQQTKSVRSRPREE